MSSYICIDLLKLMEHLSFLALSLELDGSLGYLYSVTGCVQMHISIEPEDELNVSSSFKSLVAFRSNSICLAAGLERLV